MQKHKEPVYPPGVVTSMEDLMRYEYYVQEIPLLPQHPVYSLLAGRHASRLRGRGLDFEEVRIYVPGDDIRNIDWHVTARTGVTHSKVFNEEKERPTFLLVDQSSMLFFGSSERVKSVVAAQLAALSAFYTIKRGDRVGGIVFNESGNDFITPKRSKEHVQYLLQSIVTKNRLLPERTQLLPNTQLLGNILQMARSVISHDYVLTVISDLSVMNDESRQHLRSIAMHNDVILIHITDPLEAVLPAGRLVLSDGEYQLLWENKHNTRYSESYEAMKRSMVAEFRNYRIPVVFIDTATTVESQIMQFFVNRST
ncbi:DUF58 domain-containing protein [Chitinophaga sp. MM2321]|uniref:DUF58 domain-containing protein n=1 Tax=Chitinophaga sp. MM2321 TaxID=3137178 RepID=UPI0032D574A5